MKKELKKFVVLKNEFTTLGALVCVEIAMDTVNYASCFMGAVVFSSFVEYWVHRIMHISPFFGKTHRRHHEKNTGQGVLGEFQDYAVSTSPIMGLMFLFSWQIGISFSLGAISYAAFAAYAHQLQHDNPTKCDWMNMPVHYVHHEYDQWDCNFGLAVDWWDRVFGTYQYQDWLIATEQNEPERGRFQIKWW